MPEKISYVQVEKNRWDVMHLKTKQELRKEILKLRDDLTLEERDSKSKEIAKRIITYKDFKEADKILLFASYKSEVDTTEIFAAARRLSKDIYYPKVIGDEMEFYRVECEADLKEGYRGIREPEANLSKKFEMKVGEKICVIMPGAIFDKDGNRIGYGGGFYDKFLSTKNISKIAVGFDCQIVKSGEIKNEAHDIKINVVITETKIYEIH